MMNLLIIRDKLRQVMQRYHMIAIPAARFLASYLLFYSLNQLFGYHEMLMNQLVVLGLAFIGAWLSVGLLFFLAGIVTLIHLASLSLEVAAVYLFLFLLAYTLYLHLDIKYSIPMIFGPILFVCKVSYLIPILVGMFLGPAGIVPSILGLIIYKFSFCVKDATSILATATSEDEVQAYKYMIDQLMKDKMLLLTAAVFAIVALVTWLIYRSQIAHAWNIAIVSGGVANILCLLAGGFIMEQDLEIANVILCSVIAVIIGIVVQFFKDIVDYSRIENVQFEDDEYYYYVKAVPKVSVTAKEVKVKRINARKKVKNKESSVEEVK